MVTDCPSFVSPEPIFLGKSLNWPCPVRVFGRGPIPVSGESGCHDWPVWVMSTALRPGVSRQKKEASYQHHCTGQVTLRAFRNPRLSISFPPCDARTPSPASQITRDDARQHRVSTNQANVTPRSSRGRNRDRRSEPTSLGGGGRLPCQRREPWSNRPPTHTHQKHKDSVGSWLPCQYLSVL